MIRKSGYRFSEKDHAPSKDLEHDDDSTQSHRASQNALGLVWIAGVEDTVNQL
jgi:hypothetical protein